MFSKIAKMVVAMATTLMVSASLYAVGGNVYLSTITDPNSGEFLSRSLLTFSKDGTLLVSDSDQQGESPFSAFGIEQGYWEKDGDTLEIKCIDFTYPKYFTCDHPYGNCDCNEYCCDNCENQQQIVMLKAELKKGNADKWEGPVYLTFFPLDVNNINDKNQGDGPYLTGNIILDYVFKP